jgi:hypothetical protein
MHENTHDDKHSVKIVQALINIIEHHYKKKLSLNSLTEELLVQHSLKVIATRKTSKPRVAFFAPEDGFLGNFGQIPEILRSRDFEVIWLLGQAHHFLNDSHDDKFLVVGNMIEYISNIDLVVTATVMDCLPTNCKSAVIDHISFAPLEVEALVNSVYFGEKVMPIKYGSKEEVFEKYTAYIGFLPYHDLILTPSNVVYDLANRVMECVGYNDEGPSDKPDEFFENAASNLNISAVAEHLNIHDYKDTVKVVKVGYPKLDMPIEKYGNTEPENMIIYAPTPNDATGNKQSAIWSNAITINDHGSEVIQALCLSFPETQIVFKPYRDENPEIVTRICVECQHLSNFIMDKSGSNYWELYSRAKLLVSDFSSTAYTFALGMGRPVVFFSPNENVLAKEIVRGSYCASRELVGSITTNVEELTKVVSDILDDHPSHCKKALQFGSHSFVNRGNASRNAADAIQGLFERRINCSLDNAMTWSK